MERLAVCLAKDNPVRAVVAKLPTAAWVEISGTCTVILKNVDATAPNLGRKFSQDVQKNHSCVANIKNHTDLVLQIAGSVGSLRGA